MLQQVTRFHKSGARRMVDSACLVVVAALMLAACGCDQEPELSVPTQEVLKPVNPKDSPKAQEEARMAVLLAMRRGIPPPPSAVKLKGGEPATPEILDAYNLELLRARIQERRSPETLEELVQKWIQKWRLLPALPKPPPGKRIVYDDLNCIIRLDPP